MKKMSMNKISLLKASSIMMAVGGLIMLLDAIYGEMLDGMDEFIIGHITFGALIIAIAIVQILANSLQLTVGAYALHNINNKGHAKYLVYAGIIILILQFVAFGLQTIAMMDDVVCFGCGLIIPILFITGALELCVKKDKAVAT
ncbi:hypothetical protein D6855_14860 [Butyrivibrio sp. CB08]|uniref:hypothetical protein n=1 Tax=Butyrivibrio sp. CB08 TaxID=2364879 RepID=UPI000EA84B65|nr:hypothetical protein [Butyrivibrio sp. CB08]RKM56139.1 hypothetical protein D6855_14860 [Butyrivibrio sp. CB08]